MSFWSEFLPQFCATIAGVISGSALTFYYERHKSKIDEAAIQERSARELRESRAGVLNSTLQQLGRMRADITDYRRQMMEPVEHAELAWLEMKHGYLRVGPLPQFDYGGLQFLYRSSDPNVVLEVELQAQRFSSLVQTVDERTRLHVHEYQRRMEEKIGTRERASLAEIIEAIGPRIHQQLVDLTETIFDFVENDDTRIWSLERRLRAAARSLVGDEYLIELGESRKPSAAAGESP